MSPELRQRIYNDVRRAVLWDEDRDEIFDKLAVNKITGDEAEDMFREARAERIAAIREGAVRTMFKGLVTLMLTTGIFATFWMGLGAVTRGITVVCVLLGAVGGWWFLTALVDMILAHSKKGAIGSEEA